MKELHRGATLGRRHLLPPKVPPPTPGARTSEGRSLRLRDVASLGGRDIVIAIYEGTDIRDFRYTKKKNSLQMPEGHSGQFCFLYLCNGYPKQL